MKTADILSTEEILQTLHGLLNEGTVKGSLVFVLAIHGAEVELRKRGGIRPDKEARSRQPNYRR